MSSNGDKHEVSITDDKTSKYETALKLVQVGYVGLTIPVIIDAVYAIFSGSGIKLPNDYYITWFGTTTGLIGWLLGKNGK